MTATKQIHLMIVTQIEQSEIEVNSTCVVP